MKKRLFLLLLYLLFLLAGCQKSESDRTFINVGMRKLEIIYDEEGSTKSGKVLDRDFYYTFKYLHNGDIIIYYPDGDTYDYRNYYTSSSDDGSNMYVNGKDLHHALNVLHGMEPETKLRLPPMSYGIILIVIGVIEILCSRVFWYNKYWWLNGQKPSQDGRAKYIFSGLAFIFFGIMALIAAL